MPEELTSLSSQSRDPREPARARTGFHALLAVLILALFAGLGFFGREALRRMDAVDKQLAELSAKADEAAALSRQAVAQAAAAEASAGTAAAARQQAEAEATLAREEAGTARRQATSAIDAAAAAQVEADRVRKQAEAEVNRLEQALGLVMNLGSDYLKFEFDRAELRPQDRELLSRIAGILMTSRDYSVSVNGHTDDVGSEEYNQKLSERRAEAVRDYLLGAGLPPEILSVTGHGKSRPLLPGSSEAARARNRRVELGIAHMRILQGRPDATKAPSPPGP
jgi:outer membrane protein OmpA-like peptidoglycan-associated protein